MVTDESGFGTFYETETSASNANSLVPVGNAISVSAIALDDLNLRVDFLKIDIEGAELLALRGARKTLSSLKYMTLEIHPRLMVQLGQTVNDLFELLQPFEPIYFMGDKVTTVEKLSQIEDHFEINIFLNGAII